MMEDYLGGFSDSYFIDLDDDYCGSDNFIDDNKSSEILSYIELYNGVRYTLLLYFSNILLFNFYLCKFNLFSTYADPV
jgi:hypothetical protein